MLTHNFSFDPKWTRGLIESVTGLVSYKLMLGDGSVVRSHVDEILANQQTSGRNAERQQTDTMQQGHNTTKEETLLDVEDVVLSSKKVAESAAAEPAEKSGCCSYCKSGEEEVPEGS